MKIIKTENLQTVKRTTVVAHGKTYVVTAKLSTGGFFGKEWQLLKWNEAVTANELLQAIMQFETKEI
jgi:hypothetical protein